MANLNLNLTLAQRANLKQAFKDGFIYQRFKHTCGYVGNCYHKPDGKWQNRTHCPQCDEELTWIPLEEVIKRMIEPKPDHVV